MESLNWRKKAHTDTIITVTDAGLKFALEHDMSMSAKAYLKTDLFDEFQLKLDSTQIAVDLNLLMQVIFQQKSTILKNPLANFGIQNFG